MSKRLILILALAFVVGVSAAAFAEVQNVKVSGDITVLGIMRELGLNNGEGVGVVDVVSDKEQDMVTITRVRIDADLTDNVMTTVRLINERYWGTEAENSGNDDNSNINLDLAYVTLKEFLYSPLTVTVGRQELRFGNAMIIGDPDTNGAVVTTSPLAWATTTGVGNNNLIESSNSDLSARKAFDAIRLNLNYDPLVVDIVAAKIQENFRTIDDDVSLYGINANYRLGDILGGRLKNTVVEGYYWCRHIGGERYALPNKTDRIDLIGSRLVTSPMENLIFQVESAMQFGKARNEITGVLLHPTPQRKAWAAETALTYNMPKVKYTPSVTAMYAFFSGDNNKNRKNRKYYKAWDPMFEDQKFGDIANAQFAQTNSHVVGLVGSMKPKEDITLQGEAYFFWWDKIFMDDEVLTTLRGNSVVMKHNKWAGSEIDLKAIYDYTEDVQFSLLYGNFIPGSSFDEKTSNIAQELIGSMKVTF